MTTINQRRYNTKDVEMLVTASTILETAISNKIFLQSKRSVWADPFFDDLKARIDLATKIYLGLDTAKDLREATIAIKTLQALALKDLAEVKIQITEDFKSDKIRRDEILNQLGYATYHSAAQKGDQEAAIDLLYRFKTNLTPELKGTLITKGIAEALLDKITGYADNLKYVDVLQETNKGQRKTITVETIQEFNGIYDAIMSICKIAHTFYKGQPHIQSRFSFSKLTKTLNATGNQNPAPPPPPPTT